jgi:hypothetical protein
MPKDKISESEDDKLESEPELEPEIEDAITDNDTSDSHICPYCNEPQDHFDYHKKWRGWAKCPNCGKKSRARDIPENLIREVEIEDEEPESTEQPDMDEYDDAEEEKQGEGEVFRRTQPVEEILRGVLTQFGVKKRAKQIMVERCRRASGMDAVQLENLLGRLNSGVKANEIPIVVEEFDIALTAAREEEADTSNYGYSRRTYPRSRRRDTSYGTSPRYPSRSREGSGGRGGNMLTMEDAMQLWREEDERRESIRREQEKDKQIRDLRDTSIRLEQKLEDLEDNPPQQELPEGVLTRADLADAQQDSHVKALELQLQIMQEDRKKDTEDTRRREDIARDETKERDRLHREELKEIRNMFKGEVKSKEQEIKNIQEKMETRRSSAGYTSDDMRMVSEVGTEIVRAVEKKAPIREIAILIEKMSSMQTKQEPPPRERGGASSVADLMGEEYVEET